MRHRATALALPVLAMSLLALALASVIGSPLDPDAGREDAGLSLARQYCTSCHELPEPSQLPRESWPYVLDWMGNYLGFPNTEGFLANVVDPSSIPGRPLISRDELALIRAHFLSNAPAGPPAPRGKPPVQDDIPWLRPAEATFLRPRNAIVTAVAIDEANERLFVGHANENRLLIFDAGGDLLGSARFDTQPIGVTVHDEGFYVALIGDLMQDHRNGQVLDLRLEDGRVEGHRLIAGHPRTVDAEFHDLTADGRKDVVVSGFGEFDLGRLSWFESLGDREYREHVLLDHAGSLKAEVHDFDGDGLPDVMTLVAQGRQQLLLFLNQGDGEFKRIQLLQEFPGFGFNSFELADFDDDGRMDLLLVNGNNMEHPESPLRDYHGLRIYRNEGGLRFREAYFYPMYGAMGARVADFNGDGRSDVAAVAGFPDWSAERPEGFILLEQTGPMQFTPRTHPATHGGRWVTIDAGDLNGDGAPDLVLGGGAFMHGIPSHLQRDFLRRYNQVPPVLVLENIGLEGAP